MKTLETASGLVCTISSGNCESVVERGEWEKLTFAHQFSADQRRFLRMQFYTPQPTYANLIRNINSLFALHDCLWPFRSLSVSRPVSFTGVKLSIRSGLIFEWHFYRRLFSLEPLGARQFFSLVIPATIAQCNELKVKKLIDRGM